MGEGDVCVGEPVAGSRWARQAAPRHGDAIAMRRRFPAEMRRTWDARHVHWERISDGTSNCAGKMPAIPPAGTPALRWQSKASAW